MAVYKYSPISSGHKKTRRSGTSKWHHGYASAFSSTRYQKKKSKPKKGDLDY